MRKLWWPFLSIGLNLPIPFGNPRIGVASAKGLTLAGLSITWSADARLLHMHCLALRIIVGVVSPP